MNEIDLTPFCAGAGSVRPYLENPFTWGSFTYATSGHILIRVPRRDGLEEDPDFKPSRESVEKLISPIDEVTEWRALPPLPQDARPCVACGGTGYQHLNCPTCECPCDECGGDPRKSTTLLGAPFDIGLIAKVSTLPNPFIAAGKRIDKKIPLMFFRADGCDGMVVGLTHTLSLHVDLDPAVFPVDNKEEAR